MTKQNGKRVRFAALIRVSTEKQKDKGESLRTQETQITTAVESMGGKLVKKYAGQEHATEGYERQLLEQLLADAKRKPRPFDAVMVADPSRWSRDNVRSETGLELLRDHGVKFYVLTTEYDLFDPNARLFLGMSSLIGSFQANVQKQKSLLNRIERAKRGLPTAGKLPFGRIFDKEKQKWEIDKAKQRMIADIAKRYLAGASLAKLAEEYGINHTALHKTLMERAGTRWTQTFQCDSLNIDEEVTIEIPALLDEKTIRAVQNRAKANKTFTHGQLKNNYLLSRMIFCSSCGYAMFGQKNSQGLLYYRHAHAKRGRECDRPKGASSVRADEIELNVMRLLFDMFGNPTSIAKAIEAAVPNREKVRELQQRETRLTESLAKLSSARDRILRHISNDTITEEHAKKELTKLKDREAKQTEELEQIRSSLESVPSDDAIRDASQAIAAKFRPPKNGKVSAKQWAAKMSMNTDFAGMKWKDKRSLCQTIFGGTLPDGSRMGVYIEWNEDDRKQWRFSLRGHLTPEVSYTPMPADAWSEVEPLGGSQKHKLAEVTISASHSRGTDRLSRRFRRRGVRFRDEATRCRVAAGRSSRVHG